MKIALIASEKDPASMNIRDKLTTHLVETEQTHKGNPVYVKGTIRLYTDKRDPIFCEHIDKDIEADIFIFLSKHQSRSGIRSLSVHAIGNWGEAGFGGEDRKLCPAPHDALKRGLQLLEKNNELGCEVIQEVTHHGPFLEKPVMFIEIGSDIEAWTDPLAGNVIARTCLELCSWLQQQKPGWMSAFGIGGLHHAPSFRRLMLDSDIAVGHICPKHNLHSLDEEMIRKAIADAPLIILDWKAMGKEKQRIVDLLKRMGLGYKRIKELKKIKF